MKIVKVLTTLCVLSASILLTAFSCDSRIFSYECSAGHPNIQFINHTDKTIWLEWNPRYPMESSDSLFSRFQIQVKDSMNLMPLKSECWEREFLNVPFVRIFLFDVPYNSISNHPDSLRRYQDEHLIDMHWYTQKELDSLNWTIHYPPVRSSAF